MEFRIQNHENRYNQTNEMPGRELTGKQRTSYFAGNLNLPEDPLQQKRKEAQEQALKVVKNAWETDKSIDASIQIRRDHYAELKALQEEKVHELAETEEAMAELQQLYGVAPDSQEQQDLELLMKQQDFSAGVSREALTKEEIDRVLEIKQTPLTEYQKRALEMNAYAGSYKLELQEINYQMQDDIRDIRSIQLERLKSDPMVGAQKTADAIRDAANKEIIGMVLEDGKEQVEEKTKEAKEEAEKKAEEQEAKEELQEELQEKLALQKAFIEGTQEALEEAKHKQQRNEAPELEITEVLDMTNASEATNETQESLESIKNSMNLLEADLKGIKVDEQI